LALPLFVEAGYCFMLAAALGLCMPKPSRAIMLIAFFGGSTCLKWGWGVGPRIEFERTFFGLGPGHVHYGALTAVQAAVMSLLFLVGLDLRDEERDQESSAWRQRMNNLVDTEQASPSVVDAEIIGEDRPAGSASSEQSRLQD
jgi:hypothetical protein